MRLGRVGWCVLGLGVISFVTFKGVVKGIESGAHSSTVKTVWPSPLRGSRMAYLVMLVLRAVILEMFRRRETSWVFCFRPEK